MESLPSDLVGNEGKEEFPDEFQCFVCLDLLYKPVVLACGHISCFWCVYKAMNKWQESQCPVCRHPYSHFPSICQLLHFLLMKLYPIAYRRREQQVVEEEERTKHFSPQFDCSLFGSHPTETLDIHASSPLHPVVSPILESCSKAERVSSSTKDFSSDTRMPHKDEKRHIPTEVNDKATQEVVRQENDTLSNIVHQTDKQVLIIDLSCAVCKQFLYRPVVLNCGHVCCEICVFHSNDEIIRCKVCQGLHPQGFPTVCLVLEHFLEEHFSDQYALRRESVLKQADAQGPKKKEQNTSRSSSRSTHDFISWLHGQGPKVHDGVGCDYCGMLPIIGERYKCKDCKEKMGFDLCKDCYLCSFKLPGRFNQQHTPDHRFRMVEPYEG